MARDAIPLFSYQLQSQYCPARIVTGRYMPGYGYTANWKGNGGWGDLYEALYELDPAYAQSPDHILCQLVVTPLTVPPEMLAEAQGFMAADGDGKRSRIQRVTSHFCQQLRDMDFKRYTLDAHLLRW